MKVINILIIDDNNVDRATYKHMIKEYFNKPYRIIEAVNRREALNVLNQHDIDCILLDYNLTETNGIDLMKIIKKHIKKKIPIIMITGEGNENIAVMALKSGASDYLKKDTLKPQELVTAIANATKHSNLIKTKSKKPSFVLSIIGCFVILIAGIALIGWYAHIPALSQLQRHYAPMQFNTALAFIFLGFSLLTVNRMPRVSFILSSTILIITLLTLAQYVMHTDLRIDQFFMKPYMTSLTPYPGRMGPNTAICFILSSIVLLLSSNVIEFKFKLLLEMILTSLMVVIALAAFTGYSADLPAAYGWGKLTSMGLLTSINFIASGVGLLILHMRSLNKDELLFQNYIPAAIFFAGCVFFLLLWRALTDEEVHQVQSKVAENSRSIKVNFYNRMSFYISALLRMDRRLSMRKDTTQAQWKDDASEYMKDMKSYSLIALTNLQKNIKWSVKNPDIDAKNEQAILNNCFAKSVATISPEYWSAFTNNLKYVCIIKPSATGYLVGIINAPIFMGELINELDMKNYAVVFRKQNVSLILNPEFNDIIHPNFATEFSLTDIDKSVKLEITPNDIVVKQNKSIYPWMAFAIGVLATFLFTYSLRLWALSKKRERILIEETKLRLILESRFQLITTSANDAILMLDNHDKIVFWNQAATKLFGYHQQDALNKFVHELLIPKRYRESYQRKFKIFRQTGEGNMLGKPFEMNVLNHENIEIPIEISISSVKVGSNWEAVAIMRDITERKKTEAMIHHQANYDSLTDLPNRMLFALLLKNSISQADRSQSTVYLLSLDLDGFKLVNDEHGHEIGDCLLKEVGKRLRNNIRETDNVARLGGDEFMIILTNILHVDEVKDIAQKILTEIEKTFFIENFTLNVGVSIGIASYPNDAKNIKDLLIKADQAMYASKKSGRNRFTFYSESSARR